MRDIFSHAEALLAHGRREEAVAEYGDLIDAHLGGVDPLIRRGLLLDELGRGAEAQADLETAARLEPRNGWPHLRLAQMAQARGKPWLAAACAGEAVRRQPEQPEIRVCTASIYLALGWLDLAFEVVRPVARDVDGWWGDIRREAETAYRALHARTRRELGRRKAPGDPRAFWRSMAPDLLRLGRVRAARAVCEALMRLEPSAFDAFELHTQVVAREGGVREAVGFLRAIAFLHRPTPAYRALLARMEGELGF